MIEHLEALARVRRLRDARMARVREEFEADPKNKVLTPSGLVFEIRVQPVEGNLPVLSQKTK